MTTATQMQIKEIVDRHAEQRRRVMATDSIQAAMMELAACWREEAAWFDESGKRGGKGTAKTLIECASRLAAFAVGLDSAPIVVPSQAEVDADARAILAETSFVIIDDPAGTPPVDRGLYADPLMDYLTGATNTYNPTPRPEQVLDQLKQEIPVPSATQVMDHPFSHPATPGAGGNRRNVAVVPYAALDSLAATVQPRTSVSHSFVTSQANCALASVLSEASRAKLIGAVRPSWSNIGGSALHATVEQIERAHLASDFMTYASDDLWASHLGAKIKAMLEELAGSPYADPSTWYVANGGREGFDWWRVEGATMLKRYLDFHNAEWRTRHRLLQINGVPVIEYGYTMMVRTLDGSSGVEARGYIDLAWVDLTNHSIIVTDLKSGRNAPSDTFQLGEYAHALSVDLSNGGPDSPSVTGSPSGPILGRYWLARKGEYGASVDVLKAHPISELAFRYAAAMRASHARVITPSTSNLCVSCQVRDYCPVVSSS